MERLKRLFVGLVFVQFLWIPHAYADLLDQLKGLWSSQSPVSVEDENGFMKKLGEMSPLEIIHYVRKRADTVSESAAGLKNEMSMMEDLMAKYPENFYIRYEYQYLLNSAGHYKEAIKIG